MLGTLSNYCRCMVDTWSSNIRFIVDSLSTHGRHVAESLSTPCRHIANTLSTHCLTIVDALSRHVRHMIHSLSIHCRHMVESWSNRSRPYFEYNRHMIYQVSTMLDHHRFNIDHFSMHCMLVHTPSFAFTLNVFSCIWRMNCGVCICVAYAFTLPWM